MDGLDLKEVVVIDNYKAKKRIKRKKAYDSIFFYCFGTGKGSFVGNNIPNPNNSILNQSLKFDL